MKSRQRITAGALSAMVATTMMMWPLGCDFGAGFLGVQDYQRDLLIGGLAAAALLNPPPAAADTGAGQNVPGEQGNRGLPGADGPPGPPGADGQEGADGSDGATGPQGEPGAQGEPGEQGQQGEPGLTGADGASGAQGPAGADGPELFSIFVDDFFAASGTTNGSLPISIVRIEEPALGAHGSRPNGIVEAIAYRVAVPEIYQAGNDVTMRIFFEWSGPLDDCFIMRLDARRLRDGSDIELYGDSRWIRIDMPQPQVAGEGDRVGIVIDLPLNTPAGLDFANDLEVADFLAFELRLFFTGPPENQAAGELPPGPEAGVLLHILGVEFFESVTGTASTRDATIFFPDEDPFCAIDPCLQGPDCNNNGINDSCDIESGSSQDCQLNGIPDECEVGSGEEGPGGSVFLVGHDPDFHASLGGNLTGARNINTTAISFVMDPAFNTFVQDGILKFMFVESKAAAPTGHTQGVNGIVASGYALGVDFDHHDFTTLGTAIDGLGTVYSAIVIASDFGGVLSQAELDILNARSDDIVDFINAGGGLYAMAEGNSGSGLTPNGGHYGFLPFVVSSAALNQPEVGNTVTPFGASLGLTDADVNGNASHTIYLGTAGLEIVDVDSQENILALAGRGIFNADVGLTEDCNSNGVPDECDIAQGTSQDSQPNGIPDECEEISIEGWWRFDIMSVQECGLQGAFEEFTQEVRYLRFDENNDLVENRIEVSSFGKPPAEQQGSTVCLGFPYPSTDQPSYIAFRFGSVLTEDTNRSIVAPTFDAQTGALTIEELVDVPTVVCEQGEEGTTHLDGTLSEDGNSIAGDWAFIFPEECFGKGGMDIGPNEDRLCGPFQAVRLEGEPDCPVVNAPCTSADDCNDNDACTVDTCSKGKCFHTSLPDRTACDAGGTQDGVFDCCVAGSCIQNGCD